MNDTLLFSIAKSWATVESTLVSIEEIISWIAHRNDKTSVEIQKISLENCVSWFYDTFEGCIRNQNHSFFTITGCKGPGFEQPIILQEEIGYLGIICREFDGVMHFLMQAKIEPGNVNKIQISPTLQATKSNFTQRHGGNKPPYLDYFINAEKHKIVVDQIQSEQSSRFYKKRNRNLIIYVQEEIPILSSHKWMTLGQIKRLMREDNLVNMDTRTVLSCIPYVKLQMSRIELSMLSDVFKDKSLFRSVFVGTKENSLPQIYQYINNQKMFAETKLEFVPLHKMANWKMVNDEMVCIYPYPFKIVFCDIVIEGREVRHWKQPLVEAIGSATFGLICCEDGGLLKFIVRATPEVGCLDNLELGPTIQQEAVTSFQKEDEITRFFWNRLESGEGVQFDNLLSEEGGRFYHEQNRNILLRVNSTELPTLPSGYFLLDYRTLNELVQVNNTINIQLRNLLSLLEA